MQDQAGFRRRFVIVAASLGGGDNQFCRSEANRRRSAGVPEQLAYDFDRLASEDRELLLDSVGRSNLASTLPEVSSGSDEEIL